MSTLYFAKVIPIKESEESEGTEESDDQKIFLGFVGLLGFFGFFFKISMQNPRFDPKFS
jgi:hypothetical protein